MEIIIIGVFLGLIPAMIASSKGKSFVLWWLYGFLILIVALPHALLMKPNQEGIERKQIATGNKKCPSCAEMIKSEAKVCRYCGNSVAAQ